VSDSFDLQRFVDAQASIYRQVVEELSRGPTLRDRLAR
jgi:uncharacterized protein (DUF1810 family)